MKSERLMAPAAALVAAVVLAGPPAGSVNSIGMALVRIEPGSFEMGPIQNGWEMVTL